MRICDERLVPGLVLLATFAGATACGSGKSEGAPIADAGGDTGPAGTMSILVVAPPYDFTSAPPAPNAQVAVDLPGGIHRELTVDADGRATITGIDWSLGTATVIAYGLPGRRVYGVTDVGPDTFAAVAKPAHLVANPPDLVLYLMPLSNPDPLLVVSGSISNAKSADDWVLITGTRCPDKFDSQGTSYSLKCERDAPFTLVGNDAIVTRTGPIAETLSTSWYVVDVPSQAGGSTRVNFDFATATPLPVAGTAQVHLTRPAGATVALPNMQSWVWVTSLESGTAMYLGQMNARAPTPSGIDCTVEWVSLPGQTPLTVAGVQGSNGAYSEVVHPGVPKDGETIDTLLVPPILKGELALTGPIPIVGTAPSAIVRVEVYDSTWNYAIDLDAPPGTTIVHPPTVLPPAARPKAGATLTGAIYFYGDYDQASGYYFTSANSSLVKATLP